MKSLKQYIHDHYTSVMMTIIVVSLAGSIAVLAFLSVRQAEQLEQSTEQIELLKNLADEISADQQKQHDDQDKNQACFFELFVSYVNTKEPIKQADVDKCRVIRDQSQQQHQTTPPSSDNVEPSSNGDSADPKDRQRPESQAPDRQNPDSSEPPEPDMIEQIPNVIGG